MELAVKLLQFELADVLAHGDASDEEVAGLRQAIMVLNKNLFHQKIMGSDPHNEFYAKK